MNFKEFEKKAKCYFCDRPFHNIFKKDHYDKPKSEKRKISFKEKYLYCYCSASRKYFNEDGYFFYLPVSNHYSVLVDTKYNTAIITKTKGLQQIVTLNPSIHYPGIYIEKHIYEANEFPDFIIQDRLRLIEKLKDLIVFA
jgi:phosphoglycerol transferase MdoB-like AlkP superfamily enzyme